MVVGFPRMLFTGEYGSVYVDWSGLGRIMQIKILGSAAGGGFPQWNCACSNCRAVRAGTFPGKARFQAQVAVSGDGKAWFLLGASPDLRSQIEATPELHPRDGIRQSPIAGAVLASADLDHVLGLLLLRELQPLRVFGTGSVLKILREDNSFFGILNRIPKQVEWSAMKLDEPQKLTSASCEDSGLTCTPVSLGTRYPAYVQAARGKQLTPEDAVLGLVIEGNGKRLAYMSAVGKVDEKLLQLLDSVDVLLFDGTFWSDDELIRVESSGATAQQMGHIPVGGMDGSLWLLAHLKRPRKIFIHINNTNPMLDEAGAEYRAVRDAGWEIAEDGMDL